MEGGFPSPFRMRCGFPSKKKKTENAKKKTFHGGIALEARQIGLEGAHEKLRSYGGNSMKTRDKS